MMVEFTHKLSYFFVTKEKAIYIKSLVEKPIETQITYTKKLVEVDDLNFILTYTQASSPGSAATSFHHEEPIKTKIPVPIKDDYTKEYLKTLIRLYLKAHGINSKFEVKILFNNPDGTIQESKVTSISDDADIDILIND